MQYIIAPSRLFLALVIALLVFGSQPGSAAAAPQAERRDNAALERAFAEQQRHLTRLTQRLERADARASKVAAWITKQKNAGKNTTALNAALETFRAQIGAARASWQAASNILSAHAGFGANGKVTDAAAARSTVGGAHEQLAATRQTLLKAYAELRKAVAEYRRANRVASDPQIPAEE